MRRWTWKELDIINSHGDNAHWAKIRNDKYLQFLETYGYLGALALGVAKWRWSNPKKGFGRSAVCDYFKGCSPRCPVRPVTSGIGLYCMVDSKTRYRVLVEAYRKEYWKIYGKKECAESVPAHP